MTEKHYPSTLLKDYELLLKYFPSNAICRPFLIEAIEKWKTEYCGQSKKEIVDILEIGPGFGEMTELILKKIPSNMTLIEADTATAEQLKINLKEFEKRITVVSEDATAWIKNAPNNSYDVFTASWVVHNFPHDQREEFLNNVARVLRPGGLFVIFDKVPSDDPKEVARIWETNMKRLEGLAIDDGRPDLRDVMVAHEERDIKPPYTWPESELLSSMQKLGFESQEIVNRTESDIVFSAVKGGVV